MPEISRFLGIVVSILYRDHEPPHFHATYGDYEATITIREGIVTGRFPRRALGHVLEWAELHRDELAQNWDRARAREPLTVLPPWSSATPLLEEIMDLPLVNVVEMRLVGAHQLWLRFSDGAAGPVDLRAELDGVVFEPLRDPAYFARAVLNPDLRTVTWPNGADFAPEFLRSLLPSHVVA